MLDEIYGIVIYDRDIKIRESPASQMNGRIISSAKFCLWGGKKAEGAMGAAFLASKKQLFAHQFLR